MTLYRRRVGGVEGSGLRGVSRGLVDRGRIVISRGLRVGGVVGGRGLTGDVTSMS